MCLCATVISSPQSSPFFFFLYFFLYFVFQNSPFFVEFSQHLQYTFLTSLKRNISVWGLTNAEHTKGQLQRDLKFSEPWGGEEEGYEPFLLNCS